MAEIEIMSTPAIFATCDCGVHTVVCDFDENGMYVKCHEFGRKYRVEFFGEIRLIDGPDSNA